MKDQRAPDIEDLLVPKNIFDEMIAHCREGHPYEACGILAGRAHEVLKIYRMTNTEKSPVSYLLDSREQFMAMKDMRENNLAQVAIFHSHPSSPAFPSAKDVGLAFYEDAVYVIISLMEGEPIVKGFLIREGEIREVAITIR